MEKITFTSEQQAAFELLKDFALGNGSAAMACLEGFAGTGKTTLVAKLLHALPADMPVAVMAPTNKAVGVLQAKLQADGDVWGLEFGSLHSFLGLRLKEGEDGAHRCAQDGAASLHEYRLAVIDECSMVSEALFTAVLRAKRNCRVLFVGDPAQLPPVEDRGQDSPVFRMVNLKARLNTVVRQAQENPIIAASMRVREAINANRRMSLQELMEAFPATGPSAAGVMGGGQSALVHTLVAERQAGRDARALAWRNATVQSINAQCHARLYPEAPFAFAPGERVMLNEEHRSEGREGFHPQRIFNSEECTVVAVQAVVHPTYPQVQALQVQLSRDDAKQPGMAMVYVAKDERALMQHKEALWREYRVLKASSAALSKIKAASASAWSLAKAFAPLRHTYAMTAHKAQGSTFDTALVDWDDLQRQPTDYEFNRLIYVAMTRAANFMAVVVR